jgi:hypothetical protein
LMTLTCINCYYDFNVVHVCLKNQLESEPHTN